MEERDGTSNEEWSELARFEDLPSDGTGITVEVEGQALAVFRVGERVHVLDDTCPHQGASLGCGVISRGDITCPWHGWHFDLASGSSSDGLSERVSVHATRLTAQGVVQVCLQPG